MADDLDPEQEQQPALTAWETPQIAEVDASVGPAQFSARVEVTPVGMLAIGALVSSILLSASALVWASTPVVRRRPISSRFKRR